jgi:hypothetical protein
LASFQARDVVVWKVTPGLLMVYASPAYALCRYLLTFTFSAVLPLPKTSYAAPIRGVMS